MDQKSELKVKEAIEIGAKGAKMHFAIFRSLDKEEIVNERQQPRLGNMTALRQLGLDLPNEDTETDILFTYTENEFLHIILIEVKRQDTPPWSQNGPPSKQNVNKAAHQLEKGFLFYSSLTSEETESSITQFLPSQRYQRRSWRASFAPHVCLKPWSWRTWRSGPGSARSLV